MTCFVGPFTNRRRGSWAANSSMEWNHKLNESSAAIEQRQTADHCIESTNPFDTHIGNGASAALVLRSLARSDKESARTWLSLALAHDADRLGRGPNQSNPFLFHTRAVAGRPACKPSCSELENTQRNFTGVYGSNLRSPFLLTIPLLVPWSVQAC